MSDVDAGPQSDGGGLTRALVGLGVGLAAGAGAVVLGSAAERLRSAISTRPGDWGALGSLRGTPTTVRSSDGVDLYVETDDVLSVDSRSGVLSVDSRSGVLSVDSRSGVDPDLTAPGPALTVVFTHGYALTMDCWHYQREALRGRYRLVFWDQRGHGRSGTGSAGTSTIDRLGVDLAEVIEAAAPDGPLVLVGHSMGGMTVMALARARPDLFEGPGEGETGGGEAGGAHGAGEGRVAGIALLATSAGHLARLDLGLPAFGRLVARVHPSTVRLLNRMRLVEGGRKLGRDIETYAVRRYSYSSDVAPELVRFTARMIGATRVGVIADFLPAFGTHDARTSLAVMAGVPSLVMTGDRDLMIPPSHSDEIASHLPGSSVVVLPDTGHLLMLEHPEQVQEHLDDLLARVAESLATPSKPSRRLRVPAAWRRRHRTTAT